MSFAKWFNKNKNSEILREEYDEYVNEMICSCELKPLSFKQWCKECVDWEENFGE